MRMPKSTFKNMAKANAAIQFGFLFLMLLIVGVLYLLKWLSS